MKRLLLPAAAVFLVGCNTLGQSNFECPKQENGVACLSAKEIYERTHVSDRVSPTHKDGKEIDPDETDGSSEKSSPNAVTVAANRGSRLYRPPLPEVDTPLPVRTQAKVMRIRIFPWEDNARDLNTGGFVYTEIEGRTWTLGEEQVSRVQANVISPLAVVPRSTTQPLPPTQPVGLQPPAAGRQNQAPQVGVPGRSGGTNPGPSVPQSVR